MIARSVPNRDAIVAARKRPSYRLRGRGVDDRSRQGVHSFDRSRSDLKRHSGVGVVSEHTYDAVRPLFPWKSVGDLTVKGRMGAIRAYSLENGG